MTTIVKNEEDVEVFVENPDDCDIAEEFREKKAESSSTSSDSSSSDEEEEDEQDKKKGRLEKRLSSAPGSWDH